MPTEKATQNLVAMTVMYFTIGQDLDMYVQVYLSIMSFKKQLKPADRIVVVTTDTAFFCRLDFVETLVVNQQTVDEWKGKHGFFWRIKIKAIEKVASLYPEDDLLYLDCDTFLYGDLDGMRRQLEEGKGFMDGNEGHPLRIKYRPQRMYKKIVGKTYADITVSDKHDMWCAGVVAIPSAKKEVVAQTALTLCDGMLDDEAEPAVVEQYALSIAMYERLEMVSSKPFIAHYWSNKQQWIEVMKDIILKSYFTASDPDQETQWLESIDYHAIPVYVKKHTTNKKLKNLVDTLFADSDKKFI